MNPVLDEIRAEPGARPAALRQRAARVSWSRVRAVVTMGVLLAIGVAAGRGFDPPTFSSFRVGALEISCPLGVAQLLAASQEFIPAVALAGLAGVLSIGLLGRAFCGWLCPGRWIFNRGPWQARQPWRYRAWVQGALASGMVGLAWVCHAPVFCVICPAGVVCRGAIAAGTGAGLAPTIGWLSALVGFEWLSRRSWCRDLCPLGATIGLVSRLNPFVKVKADPERCCPCLACEKVCPEGMNLSRDADLSACTKCLACQSGCPRGAVEIKWFDRFPGRSETLAKR